MGQTIEQSTRRRPRPLRARTAATPPRLVHDRMDLAVAAAFRKHGLVRGIFLRAISPAAPGHKNMHDPAQNSAGDPCAQVRASSPANAGTIFAHCSSLNQNKFAFMDVASKSVDQAIETLCPSWAARSTACKIEGWPTNWSEPHAWGTSHETVYDNPRCNGYAQEHDFGCDRRERSTWRSALCR